MASPILGKPLIEFYKDHKISPVRYVTALSEHVQCRQSLYRSLGLLPSQIRGKVVLEIGPGGGHNSLYLAASMPARLDLVEPNPVAVEQINQTYAGFDRPHTQPNVMTTMLEQFSAGPDYDIVICENWLGAAESELRLLAKLGGFVKPGGVLIISSCSPISLFSTLVRRVLARLMVPPECAFSTTTSILVSAFGPHLAMLQGMSRPHSDWCQDNLINKAILAFTLTPRLALDVLPEFTVYGSYPKMDVSWVWFKLLHGDNRRFNERFLANYEASCHNFIDYKSVHPPRSVDLNRELDSACQGLLDVLTRSELAEVPPDPAAVIEALARIRAAATFSPAVVDAIDEVTALLAAGPVTPEAVAGLDAFGRLFGREITYLALTREPDPVETGKLPAVTEERPLFTEADSSRGVSQFARSAMPEYDLTIMVPCFNEEDNVTGALTCIRTALADLPITYEILVIDDGSKDETSLRVQQYMLQHPSTRIRLHRNRVNIGLAHNYVNGAFMASGRYYRLVCGDDVEPAESLHEIFRHLGAADILLPYHTDVAGKKMARKILSKTFTAIVNLLSGYHLTYYNGGAVLETFDVRRWHVETTGFGFQAEILTRLLDDGRSYVEIPVSARERIKGTARAITFKNWLSATYSLFKIFARRVRRQMFGRPVAKG